MEVNLYGPPGSGKTTRLVRLFIAACQRVGPDKVAATTYTRAAADELRLRAGPALGMGTNITQLRRFMPWVGTIHSLKYKLLGLRPGQVVGRSEWLSKGDSKHQYDSAYDLDDPESMQDEDEQVMWLYGVARHRMISLDQLIDGGFAPESRLNGISRERARYLVREYEAWKQEQRKIDFEDMLERDPGIRLPVSVLIADEVQDNSPLLWSVLDWWGQHVTLRIHAGDPYQAIYSFAGADPLLFRRRESLGKWATIGNSHRFDEATADYARAVIRAAHGDDPILRSWQGVGTDTRVRDGSELHLARTHSLLAAHRAELLDSGTPFVEYGRRAPLSSVSGQAFRTLYRVRQGESVSGGEIADVLSAAKRLPKMVRDRRDTLAADRLYSPREAESVFGRPPRQVSDLLPFADYFKAVVVNHGIRGIFLTPKLTISTVHSAKGREADSVTLIRSWGHYPAAAVTTKQGAKDEACVAYVGVTRHRFALRFVDALDGQPYPFPSPRGARLAGTPTAAP